MISLSHKSGGSGWSNGRVVDGGWCPTDDEKAEEGYVRESTPIRTRDSVVAP